MASEKDRRRYLRLRLKVLGFAALVVCLLLLGRAVDLMVVKGPAPGRHCPAGHLRPYHHPPPPGHHLRPQPGGAGAQPGCGQRLRHPAQGDQTPQDRAASGQGPGHGPQVPPKNRKAPGQRKGFRLGFPAGDPGQGPGGESPGVAGRGPGQGAQTLLPLHLSGLPCHRFRRAGRQGPLGTGAGIRPGAERPQAHRGHGKGRTEAHHKPGRRGLCRVERGPAYHPYPWTSASSTAPRPSWPRR